jgi:hypothetical protein
MVRLLNEGRKMMDDERRRVWDDEWRRVLAQVTNEELEDRLFTYFWLAMKTPNSHINRLRELVDEAERRGQAAMVERAKLRAANYLQ